MTSTRERAETARRPLLANRGPALAIALAAWAVLLGMALWLRDSSAPTALDSSVARWLFAHTGTVVQELTIGLTDPLLTVGGCAVVAVCAFLVRRWDMAVLAAVGPLAGLLLESHVLKPVIGRRFGLVETLSNGTVKAGWAFPSGHETGVTSLTSLLVIVLLAGPATRTLKIGLTVLAVLWTALGAIGLVRSNYHYFTDTLGGIALAVGLMVTLALLIDISVDRAAGRLSSPAGRGRTRTVPGA